MAMNGSLLARYIWFVDTLRRSGRMTFRKINERWRQTEFSGGRDFPRRTFYNYRQAILDIFGIEINCDKETNEYYIETGSSNSDREGVTDWLLNSAAMSGLLSDAREISDRIFLEQVPSARANLAPIIEAIKSNRTICFTYHPFSRSRATAGIYLEPYLLKLFRQRWYVAGRNVAENRLKTYALDRITAIELSPTQFTPPDDFRPEEYFRHAFGIVVDNSEPRTVILRATAQRAKYLRALPLHASQQEMIHDEYSIFTYTMQLTPDLIVELMSLGPEITVEAPRELRTMLTSRLRETLKLYENS